MGAGFNRNENEACVVNVFRFFAAFLRLELWQEDPCVETWPGTGRAESIPSQSQRRLTARTRGFGRGMGGRAAGKEGRTDGRKPGGASVKGTDGPPLLVLTRISNLLLCGGGGPGHVFGSGGLRGRQMPG
jgi:hypothetical protein